MLQYTQINSKKTLLITLYIGLSTESRHLYEFFNGKNNQGVGFFDERNNPLVIGDVNSGILFLKENKIERVICSESKVTKSTINELIEICDTGNIELLIIPDNNSSYSKNFVPVSIKSIIAFQLVKRPLDLKINKWIKRCFDIFFSSLVILTVLSWLYPLIAVLIKFSSKGPVLFIQKRNGLYNKEFNCYKFRTMIVNDLADEQQAQRGDNRITTIGKILRKTSLDELPQFFNVLKGDMSVVGPRPHMIKHNEDYSELIGNYNYRNLVKPGITGLAQVLGYRGETESSIYLMKMRVRTDRFYIQNWNFGLDIKIIFKTVSEVFLPKTHTF
ncbi:MAG: exopolysaccharide biosynthesis polyprenyl glycosylphosphotransferase [Flavobacteriia bacterium]|nr:exopolysaccharide biosynthesis polyprenyl glycosylphosphotransferase [Flavobacteriia bacterium]OJX36759.1 MAG: hypothetical protein BGO87_13285 [Flavobacteriia bacterium 40-80]